jgi:hypothetical protein
MSSPRNASLSGSGFRFYRWHDPITGEDTDVLSVTSIRKLCGEQYNLVNWQLANLADVAMGQVKRTVIGPRGGVSEKRVTDEFPSEFSRLLAETDGAQGKMDSTRKWLMDQADRPRNIAAMRGTMVHNAIESNVEWDRIERPYVESAFAQLSQRDRARASQGVTDEDIFFVRNAMRQYWHMRATMPFLIIAREVQVWNLTHGYAGTFDALVWFLPDDYAATPPMPGDVTVEMIDKIGGDLVLVDWKTSADVYTDQVVQAHAYMTAEFVGADGVIDRRLTALLRKSMQGGLIQIRPNGWHIYEFNYQPPVVRAFLGSVAFARFLAANPKPGPLFSAHHRGEAPKETDE